MLNEKQRVEYYHKKFLEKLGDKMYCSKCHHTEYNFEIKYVNKKNKDLYSGHKLSEDYELCFLLKCKLCKNCKIIPFDEFK